MTETIRVLHVDDDPAFLDLAKTALESEGAFEVTTETDPTVALETFTPATFDVIVSDYEMPEIDGLELLESITAQYPNVPCLIFTGKGSENVASDAISIGVTDYLQKETGLDQFTLLANRLENAVEQARTTRELRREKQRRDQILEATPMGVVVHDETGAVTLVNERARELLGVSTAEMNASTYPEAPWKLVRPDGTVVDRDSLPFSRVIADDGTAIQDEAYVIERDDGKRYEIVLHGSQLSIDDGSAKGAVIVFGTR